MSTPSPIPSKAAIHALRGLIFGTSCSIVLLAEERRRRISIARAAVENGRKLKSLKRYSTAGAAALEALRDEADTDPTFGSWSVNSPSRSYSAEHGRARFGRYRSYNDSNLPGTELSLGANGPNEPTNEDVARLPLSSIPGEFHGSAQDTLAQRPLINGLSLRGRMGSREPGPGPAPSSLGGLTPSREGDARMAAWIPVKASLVDNLSTNPTFEHLRRDPFLVKSSHGSPTSALQLFCRALDGVSDLQQTPSWLVQLSQLLCVGCQHAGNYYIAGRILEELSIHCQISSAEYSAHRPLQIITSLVRHSSARGATLHEHVELAQRLFLANDSRLDCSQPEKEQLAKDIASKFINLGNIGAAAEILERTHSLETFQADLLIWFIHQLQTTARNAEAIDAFLRFLPRLCMTSNSARVSGSKLLRSVVITKGYFALEVIRGLHQLRGNSVFKSCAPLLVELIQQHWEGAANYGRSIDLFREVQEKDFYKLDSTTVYQMVSSMIRVDLKAGNLMTSQSRYENLCANSPQAREDVELRCAFALPHAVQDDWTRVRAIFESVRKAFPFSTPQQHQYDMAFSAVLQEFTKSHTWGETEELLEDFIQNLGVTLNLSLVRSIADRHARCRELRALAQWLGFCKEAGFVFEDSPFWPRFLHDCRRHWGYGDVLITSLHAELKPFGINFDRRSIPGILKKPERLSMPPPGTRKLFHARKVSTTGASDERKAFRWMQTEARNQQWNAVLDAYKRALHDGMGFSSRCLRLAVEASLQASDGSDAQARSLVRREQSHGHDVSAAVIPLVLADLERVEKEEKRWAASGRSRGKPYVAIQRIFQDLHRDGLRIEDGVFHKAAQVCLALRNYREAISVCVYAADQNGSQDLGYNIYNFTDLCQAFTCRHEYERLGWMLDQLGRREYRTWKRCRKTLRWMVHYLTKASEADKAEELRASDLAMLERVRNAWMSIQGQGDLGGKSTEKVATSASPDAALAAAVLDDKGSLGNEV